MGKNPHEETARAGGKQGYGPSDTGGGDAPHLRTKTTFSPKKTVSADGTGKVITAVGHIANINPLKALGTAYTFGKNLFSDKRTEQQKVQANIDKGYDVNNPSEMRAAETRRSVDRSNQGGDGMANVTLNTQSLITSPTADKGAGFGHQWDFKAYDNQRAATTPNVYDYTKAPYAKKGKLVRKYATGQEIKNFSKGKRFGPPPLKGPDPQGLQTILENSDYFKKLIG